MTESPPRVPTQIDLATLAGATAPGEEGETNQFQKEARELLTRLFVAVKLAFAFSIDNEALRPAFEKLSAAVNRVREHGDGMAALQFLADGVYVNKVLVKVDASTFEQGQYLFGLWSKLGVSEIAAVADTTPRDWHSFFASFQLSIGPSGQAQRLRETPFEKIRLRAVEATGTAQENIAVTERFKALRTYAVCTITIKDAILKLQQARRPATAKIKRSVQELISVAQTSESLLLALAALRRHKGEVHHHLANSAVFALVIGRRLGLSPRELCELGVQAALHDIGRAFLEAVPDEKVVAARSVQKLVHFGAASQHLVSRVVVASEVRRWIQPTEQGEGDDVFPPGGASRIVAVAHAYDLLTTPRPDRPALLADEALRLLLSEAGRRYDPVAVKVFANALGVFPVGSCVALSTGETGIVVESPGDPARASRPRVKIVRDASGALLDGFLVDLAGDAGADRRILHCVDEEEAELNPPAFLLS